MKLAIVGSRNLKDWDLFAQGVEESIADWGRIQCIVSGGAAGADSMAEEFARANKYEMQVLRPNWKRYGRRAGIKRNTDIINAATHVLAFPSHKGKGTQDSIKKAQANGLPCKIFWIDE